MELMQSSFGVPETLIGKINIITLEEMLVIHSKIRDLDETSKKMLNDLTSDFYYRRSICEALNIDYNNLTDKERGKIKGMVYLSMFGDDFNN